MERGEYINLSGRAIHCLSSFLGEKDKCLSEVGKEELLSMIEDSSLLDVRSCGYKTEKEIMSWLAGHPLSLKKKGRTKKIKLFGKIITISIK
jgi:hypothetical protein